MVRSKVKSKSHLDAAHLQSPHNVPTKYQLSSPYGYIAQTILKVKVTTARSEVKSRSHHDVAQLRSLINIIPSVKFLYLTVSEIEVQATFFLPPTHPDTMDENKTVQ